MFFYEQKLGGEFGYFIIFTFTSGDDDPILLMFVYLS